MFVNREPSSVTVFANMSSPPTHYARSGEASIAYQVLGDGPCDLVVVNGPASHLELMWEEPHTASAFRTIAEFARVILHDRRGTGLSDSTGDPPTLEQQVDDLQAVLSAAGADRVTVLGSSDLGLSALYAATNPDTVTGLVLSGVAADGHDMLRGPARDQVLDAIERSWGDGALVSLYAPSQAHRPEFMEWWGRMQRSAASPGMAQRLLEMTAHTSLRDVLPTIRVPTLVVHARGDRLVPVERGREVAELIPGARFVVRETDDAYCWVDIGWLSEVEEFLTGRRSAPAPDRVLATVLFTDIVDSTAELSRVGDREWRSRLEDHDHAVRTALGRWRGQEIKTSGDGFLATFDGPARAVRCAADVVDAVGELGLHIRAGIHTGECELRGDDVSGIAVHIASRVMHEAGADEVLASSTVKDLVAGSGLRFADRGVRVLRGVPDEWRLYALDR